MALGANDSDAGVRVEFVGYWRRAGRIRWLLVLAPVLAGIVAGVLALRAPPAHRAEATVSIPTGFQPPSPTLVRQLVADYMASVVSPETYEAVASRTDTGVDEVRAAVTPRRLSDSNVAVVSATLHDPDAAERMAETAAREGLLLFVRSSTVEAQQAVASAQDALDAATAAERGVDAASNSLSPATTRDLATTRVSRLRHELLSAQIAGDNDRATRVTSLLERAEEELATVERRTAEYDQLLAARLRAEQLLVRAEEQLSAAQATAGFAESARAVTVTDASQLPLAPIVVQYVAGAAVLALLAAIAVLWLLQLGPVGGARTPPRGGTMLDEHRSPEVTGVR